MAGRVYQFKEGEVIMFSVASLTYCGFNFHGLTDIDRRDVENMLVLRNQGLKPSYDYLFQPMQTGWQVSGITDIGARAVCVVAQALKIIPNRIDITLTLSDVSIERGEDYNSTVGKLCHWFKVNKPKLNISELLPLSGDRKILFGSKNSRWCLWVAERVDMAGRLGGDKVEITWTLRNDNCKAAWEYFVSCGSDRDFEFYSREAFSAATNTILGTGFFGLGLSEMPYLKKEKPGEEQKDWYTYLSTVAKKLVKHYIDDLDGSPEADIKWLEKETGRLLDKFEQIK